MTKQPYPPLPLPEGITERYIDTDDLTYHVLEAGYDASRTKPLILLLHGFPELAFSWRKVMLPIATDKYHVVAYDQRGYGRTTGWDARPFSEVDLRTFAFSTLVTDAVRLVYALGYNKVECVIGHDFGSLAASLCAMMRGDIFKSLIMMSHPFTGPPKLPFDIARSPNQATKDLEKSHEVHKALAELPRPRKHYKWYYSTEPASHEMTEPMEHMHEFLRGYFHLKSADWAGNNPHPLKSFSAPELVELPNYYVMPFDSSMREVVAADMAVENPNEVKTKSNRWLPDGDLAVYASEFSRNTFQGGLNWYRVATDPANKKDLELFAGKKIEVPSLYIAGKKDWGTFQEPGAAENLKHVCRLMAYRFVEGAGHWLQQEQPEEVVKLINAFLEEKWTEPETPTVDAVSSHAYKSYDDFETYIGTPR